MYVLHYSLYVIIFFNDTATTDIYTLYLHDALPISARRPARGRRRPPRRPAADGDPGQLATGGVEAAAPAARPPPRSEEHTSELQSRQYLVCRLMLEKKRTSREHW